MPMVPYNTGEMSETIREIDRNLLDVLRRDGPMRVSGLQDSLQVTANAVRTRLTRLMDMGLVERQTVSEGRGRPSHTYRLSEAGRRSTGSNFADLAVALWDEVRSIKDPDIRRGLLQRLTKRLAPGYSQNMSGETVAERMQSVVDLLGKRDVPFEVGRSEQTALPVLTALGCPYNELAEQDRSICSLEKMLFSELVGQGLKLSQCRLDGETCCTFELN